MYHLEPVYRAKTGQFSLHWVEKEKQVWTTIQSLFTQKQACELVLLMKILGASKSQPYNRLNTKMTDLSPWRQIQKLLAVKTMLTKTQLSETQLIYKMNSG